MHPLALLFLSALAPAGTADVVAADRVTFYGVDYSHVQMIGTEDFRQPDQIFPGYLDAWNELVASEQMGQIASNLGNKEVRVDFGAVTAANQRATADQVVRRIGASTDLQPQISPDTAGAMISAYDLAETGGVGMVMIADTMIKSVQQGCYHTVFFDIATREPHAATHGCYATGGFGFRNYWFNPVKEAIADLKDTYKKWKKAG